MRSLTPIYLQCEYILNKIAQYDLIPLYKLTFSLYVYVNTSIIHFFTTFKILSIMTPSAWQGYRISVTDT